MTKLKVPSLQHLSRLYRPDPLRVTKELLKLLENGPTFSYEPLYEFTREMLIFKVPLEQILQAVELKVRREDVKKRYLDILPLIDSFFKGKRVAFTNPVSPRYFMVDKDLQVPFTPPMIYGEGGKLFLPWFIFWKLNPLHGENLSLFVTLVEETLKQDSDLEDAQFLIVDLSFDEEVGDRTLKVRASSDIQKLSDTRKREMLAIFAEGFRDARRLASLRVDRKRVGAESEMRDASQMLLI